MSSYLVAIFTILTMVCYLWSRRKLYRLSAKLPGPTWLPIFGNSFKIVFTNTNILDIFANYSHYSSPFRLWMGPRLVVCVKKASQMQTVLQSPKMANKAFIYDFLRPFFGCGLFTENGERHRHHRKLLQPFFGANVLKCYSHLMQKHALKLSEALRTKVDKEEFDLVLFLHDSAFSSSLDIFLEEDVSESDLTIYPNYIRNFYNIFFKRVTEFWLHFDCIYKRTKMHKMQEELKNLISKKTRSLIADKLPYIVERVKSSNTNKKNDLKPPPSLLELFVELAIENPNLFTMEEYTDHFLTFLGTSQDTQSTAIAFTCMMLGMFPEVQDKVYSEITDLLDGRKIIELEDVAQLKYLEMCIKESLRLFPVAPFIFRDTVECFKLDDEIKIPKNVTVLLSIYDVHRDPNEWQHPISFFPEHFLPDAVAKRDPFAFLPFSAGSRKCIAQHYSYVNMKMIIGTLLLNYKFHSEINFKMLRLKTDISVRPVNGYQIKICSR